MERTIIIPAIAEGCENCLAAIVGGGLLQTIKNATFDTIRPRRQLPKMSAAASKNRGVLRHPPMGALCFVTWKAKKVLTWCCYGDTIRPSDVER